VSNLELRPTRSDINSTVCLIDECYRKGRYRVTIADHPLISEGALSKGQPEVICERHARQWRECWADMAGEVSELGAAA